VCVRMRVCVRACVRACVYVCVCARVRVSLFWLVGVYVISEGGCDSF